MDEIRPIDVARVSRELGLTDKQVANAVDLLDSGNTVPFITRYRKEQTGNLDEVQLRDIQQRVRSQRQLAERAETVLRLIDSQGKLTPKLRAEIQQAETLKRLDDLYLPYRPKRQSRATIARERGLSPLAERIWNRELSLPDLETEAAAFIDEENGLPDTETVLQGVSDILAEQISESAEVRARCRRIARKTGRLKVTATKKGETEGLEYRNYFDYSEMVTDIPPHRSMALNRGEKAGALRVKFEWDHQRANTEVLINLRLTDHPCQTFLEDCVNDAISRLIQPSLERELRRELSERAEKHAVSVFARNLRNLLLQAPLRDQRVLAVDPGFRTGCKIAVLDEFGNCLVADVIYVTGSDEKKATSREKLVSILTEHNCRQIAIGNGTACREAEELVSELIARDMSDVRYYIVNEAGASVYSASSVAREEFPDLDATVRGTISIGRRLQDPLSEMVKIEPQHLGVGMYQHDLKPKRLQESMDEVIESCVNYVGVDLNTASASLLRHVSGFNQLIARRVVEWREQHGPFTSRQQLQDVSGVGAATFTQAAGFLKITGGDDPLDGTWIHPERYEATRKLLARLSIPLEQLVVDHSEKLDIREHLENLDVTSLAEELDLGLPTFHDILDALSRPGRDPRTDQPGPAFKQGILKLEDLHEGMELTGTVLNVVDFGAFVDIGLKDSGLVHISQMSEKYIESPHDAVAVGEPLTVWVLDVDRERRRVSLTMIDPSRRQSQPSKAAPLNATAN
ncbi:MAG: RNA-binding transcriptional accessory protein [Planctomycetes bacterium]|nr:RNA-binding transcriptional accessory protein [Planctomycetota bacterium]